MFTTILDHGTVTYALDPTKPSYEKLVQYLEDLPIYIPLPDTKDLTGGPVAAWVGDDFMAREARNEVQRNIVGTVLMWALGAPRQPYAGTIIFTGVRENMLDGRVPADLSNEGLILTQTLAADIARVIDGDPNPDTPDALRTQFLTDVIQAHDMEYEAMSVWTFDQ